MYENRVVCFLDILGFKKIIENSEFDGVILKKVLDALNFIKNYKVETNEHNGYINSDRMVTQFSDSIIISFPISNDGQLIATISEILYLIVNLIGFGFLLRGGITYGKIIHNHDIAFGPAFIEAYELETMASNPRVVVSSNLYSMLFQANNKLSNSIYEEASYTWQYLEQDDDEYYYVDYFNNPNEHDNYYEYFMHLSRLRDIISIGLNNMDVKIKNKYEWMRNKYNAVVHILQFNDQSSLEYEIQEHINALTKI